MAHRISGRLAAIDEHALELADDIVGLLTFGHTLVVAVDVIAILGEGLPTSGLEVNGDWVVASNRFGQLVRDPLELVVDAALRTRTLDVQRPAHFRIEQLVDDGHRRIGAGRLHV